MEKYDLSEMPEVLRLMQVEELMMCNGKIQKFGLSLTKEDALMLSDNATVSLKESERLEIGESILPKLIFAFGDSPFVYQDNFVDTIGALQEIFYMYKNEALEQLSDDELLAYMKEMFDGECQGSLEFLEETCLEDLCRRIRADYDWRPGKNG